jgi:PAS domain S-box-containing protein
MRRFVRREFAADYLALAYAVAYYVWLALRTPRTPSAVFIGDVSFYPLGLAVGWVYLRNARLDCLDRRTRAAWATLGGGALALWLIGNTWPRLVSYFGASAYPNWVGVLEIVQHLLLIAAFLAFPARSGAGRDRARSATDLGLVLVAGFVLAFHFGARATAGVSPATPEKFAIAQSMLDWAVFVAAAAGVLHKRDEVTRVALGWLLAANTLYLGANYLLSLKPDYQMGDGVDGVWFAAWCLRWTAARIAWHRYREVGPASAAGPGVPVSEFRRGLFSYLLVAGTFALLILQVAVGTQRDLWLFVSSATTMASLLLFRQVVELRENRRLFAAQLAQEARFRSLVQNASDIVLIVGVDERVVYASPSAERALGDGAAQEGVALGEVVAAEDLAPLRQLLGGTPGRSERLQCRLATTAGAWREVEVIATDMRADPHVGGLVLTCRDVTERNELERQLRHAQKLDAVGHLAGGLAHDFNNVLAAIRGYTELLLDDLPAESPARADLTHIEHAVDRAAAVTRKLLAFSRKQAVQPTSVDLNSVLRDLEPLLRQLLTDRVNIETDCDPGLWPVKADQGQMEQALINLITNARDAMPHGGKVQITTANHHIGAPSSDTGSLPAGDYVAVVVSDQGTGIPEELHHRIFDPFFSTKPKDRGIGLGLAMVHGIVTGSGGHVAVESRVGHGSTFTILLPRSDEAATVSTPGQPQVAASGRGSRVLLVDDELGVRTIAGRMLSRSGYVVAEAASGQDALAQIARGLPVDLLVTDLVMPGLHGHDLIDRVRELCGPIPVVCITGFAGEKDGDLVSIAGVSAVVTKPFSSEVLLRAVAAVLARPVQGERGGGVERGTGIEPV